MTIQINNNTTIEEIKNKFHRYYPFLKLEFYKSSHMLGEGSENKDLIKENLQISKIRKDGRNKSIYLSPDSTVYYLEHEFEKLFGFHVQVFRKSKSLWLETTATDKWTLREQNNTAKEMES